jgi:DNA-binding Lrp family transcriptional regulator
MDRPCFPQVTWRVQRLEAEGVIRGYRAVIDPAAVGRSFEVDLTSDAQDAQDAETVERFEQALVQAEEVVGLRRLFGSPDYFVRVAVADLAACPPGCGRSRSPPPATCRSIPDRPC